MDEQYNDEDAAKALLKVLPKSEWVGVQLARVCIAIAAGDADDTIAEAVFRLGPLSRPKCLTAINSMRDRGFLHTLEPRADTGSSVNPITKLFPATVTESRFIAELDRLVELRPTLDYKDDREAGHTLSDFTLIEGELELPVNIKNAGTRFENAQELVGIQPNDCIPIPAYKAFGAVEKKPNLLYAVAVDYTLPQVLRDVLPTVFSRDEKIVWDVLSNYKGPKIRRAEDAFIWAAVNTHWNEIEKVVSAVPFHVVSARKSVTILKNFPQRTPGIGMRAWGNRASAEVNVHLSISGDTKPWTGIADRILSDGISDIVEAVNRRKKEWVYDPEI